MSRNSNALSVRSCSVKADGEVIASQRGAPDSRSMDENDIVASLHVHI